MSRIYQVMNTAHYDAELYCAKPGRALRITSGTLRVNRGQTMLYGKLIAAAMPYNIFVIVNHTRCLIATCI